jgi:hypothetical protein
MKWVEGSEAVVVREIISALVDVWFEGTPPGYWDMELTEPGYYAKCHNVATEGDTIAIAYLYSYTKAPSADRYEGSGVFKIDISKNGGTTWETKEIAIAGEILKVDPEWASMLPCIAVSNDNIVVYLIGGTNLYSNDPMIYLSTNDGDTWSKVFDLQVEELYPDYPWVFTIQAKGSHVVLTGCKFGSTYVLDEYGYIPAPMAFLESHDAGVTWEVVGITPTPEEQILVPV